MRFAGSEPDDTFTRQYNNRMMTALGNVAVVERLRIGGETVSASTVRRHIATGNLTAAATLVPKTSLPYLVAHLATRALTAELDTTPKPDWLTATTTAHTATWTISSWQKALPRCILIS